MGEAQATFRHSTSPRRTMRSGPRPMVDAHGPTTIAPKVGTCRRGTWLRQPATRQHALPGGVLVVGLAPDSVMATFSISGMLSRGEAPSGVPLLLHQNLFCYRLVTGCGLKMDVTFL